MRVGSVLPCDLKLEVFCNLELEVSIKRLLVSPHLRNNPNNPLIVFKHYSFSTHA
jgi:hypothetical protein